MSAVLHSYDTDTSSATTQVTLDDHRQATQGGARSFPTLSGWGAKPPTLTIVFGQPVVKDQMSVSPNRGAQAVSGFGGSPASASVRSAMRQVLMAAQGTTGPDVVPDADAVGIRRVGVDVVAEELRLQVVLS